MEGAFVGLRCISHGLDRKKKDAIDGSFIFKMREENILA